MKSDNKMKEVLIFPGDGIGPEIISEAEKVLGFVDKYFNLNINISQGLIGGAAIDAHSDALPSDSLDMAHKADAILLGAVGGPKWDQLPVDQRPEKAGLLKLRSELSLFANLRPAILYPQLVDASSLKPELVSGLDTLIVRELTGGVYFGQPRGIKIVDEQRYGYNTYGYHEYEIRRIAKIAFESAQLRGNRLCSVDKANVLEATMLWREIVSDMSKDYPDVELTHMYVDNAAMQLIKNPKQFDVIVTGNMFGDILSDAAAMLTGSIGMLPSASLNENNVGLYEPCHGSAPDIAGQNIANPLATILSVSMMLKYSFSENDAAAIIEKAVGEVLNKGLRTSDIMSADCTLVDTKKMGDAVLHELIKLGN
jgi:3-isopropylmalate dehydrogenase